MTTPTPDPTPKPTLRRRTGLGERRSTARAEVGRPAALGGMLVGLTVALLTLAGTTPIGIGRATDEVSRVSLDQRIFSCTGGIKGSTGRAGNLEGGIGKNRALGSPVKIVAAKDVARGAFAAQFAQSGKALAWLPCPEPRAKWWFVGAGGAAISHDTVVTVTNPRPGAAIVDLDVYGPDGVVDSPGLHGITLAGGKSQTFDLAKTAPSIGTLAVSVTAKRGLVSASAVDRLSIGKVGATVSEWLPPQALPANATTLVGLPSKPDSAVLVVANPRGSESIATVSVIGSTGTFTPKGTTSLPIAPYSVQTLDVTKFLDGSPMAVRVSSSHLITATIRSIDHDDTSFATGVQAIRGSTAFAVPAGSGKVVLSSVGKGGTMRLVAYDQAGKVLLDKAVKVGARSSKAVRLPAKVRYVGLTSASGDIVAGFVVRAPKGTAAAGVSAAIRSIRLPAVRPGF